MASQITSLTIVYPTVYLGADKKKTSKLRVTDLCSGNSSVTGEFSEQKPVTRKMFPFDDVIMARGYILSLVISVIVYALLYVINLCWNV